MDESITMSNTTTKAHTIDGMNHRVSADMEKKAETNRKRKRKVFKLTKTSKCIPLRVFMGVQVLPKKIKEAVNFLGGFQEVIKNRKWQKVREALKLPHSSSSGAQLRSIYISYFPNCASIANALTKTVNKGGHYTSRGGGEIKMKPIGNKKIRKKKVQQFKKKCIKNESKKSAIR